jgi:hypothetical protein
MRMALRSRVCIAVAALLLPVPTDGRASTCAHPRVVIGGAFGYSSAIVRPFVESFNWAQLHRHVDGLLLVNRLQQRGAWQQTLKANRTRSAAAANGMHAVAPDEDYPFRSVIESLGFSADRLPPPHSLRYLHVVAVLRWRPCYKKVLLTDTRDVYFQADPFVAVRDLETLYATQEQVRAGSSCCTLQGNPMNRGWLQKMDRVYPTPLRKEGPPLPILNSGITLGGTPAVLRYAEKMVEVMRLLHGHGVLNSGGMDQAVHNVVVWQGLVSGMKIRVLTNEEGPVFHNVCWDPHIPGLEATALHATDPFGALMNGHRTQVAAMVHQYDRCPSLMSRLPFLQAHSKFELRTGAPKHLPTSMKCKTWEREARESSASSSALSSPYTYRPLGIGMCLTELPEQNKVDDDARCELRFTNLEDATGNCSLHDWCRGVVRDNGLACGGLHGVPRRAAASQEHER